MTGFLPRVRWIPLKFKGTMQGGLDFPPFFFADRLQFRQAVQKLYAQKYQNIQETSGFWGSLLQRVKTWGGGGFLINIQPWNSAWEICSGASGSSTNSFARNYKFRGEENVHKQLWTASHHFLRLHVMLHVETLCMNFASSGLVHQ